MCPSLLNILLFINMNVSVCNVRLGMMPTAWSLTMPVTGSRADMENSAYPSLRNIEINLAVHFESGLEAKK